MIEIFTLLFLLVAGHALADFVLQNEVMAMGKNRHSSVHQKRGPHFPPWPYWLGAHTLIHGAVVYLLTHSLLLALAETLLHSLIDFLKCEGKLNFHQDQLLHLLCKVAYCGIIASGCEIV